MGLFSHKKPVPASLPEFPRFPEVPAQGFPRQEPIGYEPQLKPQEPFPRPASLSPQPVEQPVAPQGYTPSIHASGVPGMDIPRREHLLSRPEPVADANVGARSEFERPPVFPAASQPSPSVWGPPPSQRPELVMPPVQQASQQPSGERPVFVKLQEYREAMASIEVLKQKIRETEGLLGRIDQLRSQEQVEMAAFRDNLNKIKEKLVAIDKRLFEA